MELLAVMKEEKGLLLEILEILQTEKEALIKNKPQEIEEIVKTKEELRIDIDEVETRRNSICGGKKLKEILAELDGTDRIEAENIGREIEGIVSKIQDANDINHILINQSLNYVKTMINIMSPKKPSVYGANGRMDGGAAGRNLVNKSV